MAPKQRHRAPKLKTAQHMFQERTSSATLEPISIHKEDQAVEEKQSYAMITGLLQVLVHMHCPRTKRQPTNLPIRYQGGQHCLSTVGDMCYRPLKPVS